MRRACCLVAALALTLALAPSAGASGREGAGASGTPAALSVVGPTVIAAIAPPEAGSAVNAIGNSLALLDAKFRVRERMREAPPRPAVPLTEAEVARNPDALPPASAGSNGSVDPHAASERAKIFAHTRLADAGTNAVLLTGIALAPPGAPEAVKAAINAANTIVGRPYVWGGGHGSFYSNGYDCSGSVSFALFGAGLIPRPLTSGELEGWGAPGPGRWITVYANGGHTFAEIAGLRWDTVGDARGTGPRWHLAPTSTAGFVARHPPGY